VNRSFKLTQSNKVDEYNLYIRIYEHLKTKAKVIYLIDKNEKNLSFSIGFKTPPSNSKGIPHILEHSVLSGSKQYPLKDPFFELLRTSQATYLNASTFPAITVYPVSSKIEKDFFNLMDVYLDSVFNPLLTKNIFKREGYAYLYNSESKKVELTGIVYNEMKGLIDSIDRVKYRSVFENLLQDSPFSYDSGGKPKEILNLSYRKFKNFYRKYYHPSNSLTVFHGNINITKTQNVLNKYFNNYLAKKPVRIPHNKKANKISHKTTVKFSSNDLNTAHISYIYKVPLSNLTVKDIYAFDIISTYIKAEYSEFYKNLVKKGITKSIDSWTDISNGNHFIFVTELSGIKNDEKTLKKAEFVYKNALELMIANNNKSKLKAIMNRMFYKLAIYDSNTIPRGILFARDITSQIWSTKYGLTDFVGFYNIKTELENDLENTNYFENLFSNVLIKKNEFKLIYIPDNKIISKYQNFEKQKIKEFFKSINDIKKFEVESEDFIRWKEKPDTQKIIQTIPKLKLSDLPNNIDFLPVKNINDEILFSDISANNIIQLNFVVDINNVKLEELSTLELLLNYIGYGPTKKRTSSLMSKDIDTYIGKLSLNTENLLHSNKKDFVNKIIISTEFLPENLVNVIEIIIDMYANTKITKKDLTTLINEDLLDLKNSITTNGHTYTGINSKSGMFFNMNAIERNSGLEYTEFLEKSVKKSNELDKTILKLKDLYKKIRDENSIKIHIGTSEKTLNSVYDILLTEMKKQFKENNIKTLNKPNKKCKEEFTPFTVKNAFYTNTSVNYVAQSYKLETNNEITEGNIYMITNLIDSNYIKPMIRYKGGAYGGIIKYSMLENVLTFMSYRDPNLSETIKIYENVHDFLQKTDLTRKELEEFKLGALQYQNSHMTKPTKSYISLIRYLKGIKKEILEKDRIDILTTDTKDINQLADILGELVRNKKNNISTSLIGNKKQIEEENLQKHGFKLKKL